MNDPALTNPRDALLGILAPACPQQLLEGLRARVDAFLAAHCPPGALESFMSAFAKCGTSWGYQPGHPLPQKVIEVMTALLVGGGKAALHGLEHCLEARRLAQSGVPVVMVGNHLSYGDVNLLQALLALQGPGAFPLLVMAGPKVYLDPFRKFSSMAFDTLRMAQPPSRASEGAGVSPRELAEITHKVMADAREWQGQGRILYFFPEGSRSRDGQLHSFLPAASRYLEASGTMVYPVGYTGTENLIGVQGGDIRAEHVEIRVGRGIPVDRLQGHLKGPPGPRRKVLMDVLGFAVAALLKPDLRGDYASEGGNPADEGLRMAFSIYLTEIAPS